MCTKFIVTIPIIYWRTVQVSVGIYLDLETWNTMKCKHCWASLKWCSRAVRRLENCWRNGVIEVRFGGNNLLIYTWLEMTSLKNHIFQFPFFFSCYYTLAILNRPSTVEANERLIPEAIGIKDLCRNHSFAQCKENKRPQPSVDSLWCLLKCHPSQ